MVQSSGCQYEKITTNLVHVAINFCQIHVDTIGEDKKTFAFCMRRSWGSTETDSKYTQKAQRNLLMPKLDP